MKILSENGHKKMRKNFSQEKRPIFSGFLAKKNDPVLADF